MSDLSNQQAGYSRVVSILKIVLPLTALVLLSLVFLLARTIDPTQAIPMADIDVQERARDPRLSGARFAGVTSDGAALSIVTQTARSDPHATLRLEVTGLDLLIEGSHGESLAATAEAGVLDRGTGRFEMSGGLEFQASPGYDLTSDRLVGLLDSTLVQSPGAVAGRAPAGEISAGNMVMRTNSGDEPGYVLVFGGGVRLLYQPEN
jgi:lipopolysaccharide export system protein LptC